jgi:hypothetical protein
MLIVQGVFMSKLAIGLVVILSSFMAFANSSIDLQDPYYQISDMTVEVLDSSDTYEPPRTSRGPGPGSEVGDIISVMREIIAFGKEIYKIVEAGKPVINTNYAPISVLPLDTEFGKDITPMKLSRWQAPKFVKFKVTYKNGYNADVVSF